MLQLRSTRQKILVVTSPGPSTAAPTPTKAAGIVTSLFSNAYTNVGIDTWSAPWDMADVEDVMIAGNATKKYTNHTFSGIEFTGVNLINATSRTHFHLDVWTADAAGADGFKVKLVDFGADGTGFGPADNSEGEVLNLPAIAAGTWVALDIPLADFMAASPALTSTAHLAQLIPSGGGTVFMDNIYFYANAVLAVELSNVKAKAVNSTTVLT